MFQIAVVPSTNRTSVLSPEAAINTVQWSPSNQDEHTHTHTGRGRVDDYTRASKAVINNLKYEAYAHICDVYMCETMSPYQAVECLGSENTFALWLHNKESNKSEPAGGGGGLSGSGGLSESAGLQAKTLQELQLRREKKKYFTGPHFVQCSKSPHNNFIWSLRTDLGTGTRRAVAVGHTSCLLFVPFGWSVLGHWCSAWLRLSGENIQSEQWEVNPPFFLMEPR